MEERGCQLSPITQSGSTIHERLIGLSFEVVGVGGDQRGPVLPGASGPRTEVSLWQVRSGVSSHTSQHGPPPWVKSRGPGWATINLHTALMGLFVRTKVQGPWNYNPEVTGKWAVRSR